MKRMAPGAPCGLDKSGFLRVCQEVMAEGYRREGIGTLGEKTQHAVLKRFFGPEPESREVRVGPYVADVFGPDGIIEIQTRGFDRLRGKLGYFLQGAPVTVVYPVPAVKWLITIEEDGTPGPRRRSPKRPGPWEILPELYRIKPLLMREGLSFCVLLLEVEEYRLQRPERKVGRKRTACYERMPVRLLDSLRLGSPEDFRRLVPEGLTEFTAAEYGKAARLPLGKAQAAVNVLRAVGAAELAGRKGRAYLYRPSRPQTAGSCGTGAARGADGGIQEKPPCLRPGAVSIQAAD